MSTTASNPAMASGMKATFYGWHVVAAVFVLATFGWGLGFYGPPVYLHAVHESRGWSLNVVSTAVTVHFLFGAIVIANLPRLYRRFGLARVTKAGSLALAIGVTGWALAQEPWQLFVATLFSGGGWVTMGAAAVNAIVAPWFVRKRPAALASAYNGSSIGGVVFSPLWVAAIGLLGFPSAAIAIGVVVVATIWILADLYYSKTPESMGLHPDGDAPQAAATTLAMTPSAKPLPNTRVWSDWRLVTLAAGMALGLFAQIGLLAHLFSLLVPALGAAIGGICWRRYSLGDIGPDPGRLANAGSRRPATFRLRQLRRADFGLARLLVRGRRQHPPSVAGRRFIRGGDRQHDVVAADDCPGRIFARGRVPGRPADRRSRARHLCLCAGRLRAHSRTRTALGLGVGRRRTVVVSGRSFDSNIGGRGVFHWPTAQSVM
jgi:MFS family permease